MQSKKDVKIEHLKPMAKATLRQLLATTCCVSNQIKAI